MNIFNPKDKKLEIKLIYYREQLAEANIHRYVFKLKNNFAPRYEYVGIVSVVPAAEIDSGKYKHFIVRYINTTKLKDVISLLGIYEAKDDDVEIPCPNMKQQWLSYLFKKPYIIGNTSFIRVYLL